MSLFNTVNIILCPPNTLPSHLYSSDLCDKRITFFNTKIQNIHQQITFQINVASDLLYLFSHDSLLSLFYCFELPTIEEIAGLIKLSKSSTCQLDPLPPHMV